MEETMWTIFNNYVLPALVSLALALFSYLLKKLTDLAKSHIPSQATRTMELVDKLARIVQVAVAAVMQEEAEALKEADKDGKLDDAEKFKLKQIAIDKVKLLGADIIAELKVLIPDIDKVLSDLIEHAVSVLKKKSS